MRLLSLNNSIKIWFFDLYVLCSVYDIQLNKIITKNVRKKMEEKRWNYSIKFSLVSYFVGNPVYLYLVQ